jgi:hypothetical protein
MAYLLRLLSLFFLVNVPFQTFAQNLINQPLKKVIKHAVDQKNPLIIGTSFIGLPYKAFALSAENPEKLVIDFRGFDCVTFVENVLALYQSQSNEAIFQKSLINMRYQNPDSLTYESRNHYFTSALLKLQKQAFLQPVRTGKDARVKKNFGVLSQFLVGKGKNIRVDLIQKAEMELSQDSLTYIPSNAVQQVVQSFQSGDIVVFMSKKSNLDCQHVGFLTYQKGELYILHASQEAKKVLVSEKTLINYLKTHPNFLGIQVFRPNFKHETIPF